ncbi:MAG: phosphoribosylformylglycinamidine synthase subunit PurS [Ignavibacterium sp.]|nr:phosphoribosylformylglycinamidine synthase subunit PurS [Ignavibacterium sp.]MCX7611287.1 phosphoribosylformylglycinamidine synthase subunit PurS [Ignavibacterium sp.]MDW8375639.1 phosphoribosylformylglycinamidine synthase subunit PurS [Ignavibacteriales bacterium]
MFRAQVIIKRKPSILDPQGKAVEKGAQHLGLTNIKNTRIGKYIEFDVISNNREEAEKEVNEYCSKLLSNPIMEDYQFNLIDLNSYDNK